MIDVGKKLRWLLPTLVMVAALFRLPGLQDVPPLLNQDEASRGYDAWCLLETGADRHGQRWPFFLQSFGPGDYTAALTTYLTMPFVAWLGPSATAMRLPDALFGIATVLLLFIWLRRQADLATALLAAFVLALDPWHIALCRTAHESGFTPFFLVLALMALYFAGLLPDSVAGSAGERSNSSTDEAKTTGEFPWRRAAWGVVGGMAIGGHAWAYPATRLFTPLFCLAIAGLYLRGYITAWKSGSFRKVFASAFAGLVIGAAPLWMTAIRHPEHLAARAQATLLFHQDLSAMEIVGGFFANYAANLHPRYWFIQADEMSGASIPNVGQHLVILSPIWLIGIFRILSTCRRSRWARLMVAWFLLYPVPAALCADWNPHPMRTVAGIVLFPIVAAIGGQWLMFRLASLTQLARQLVFVVTGLFFFVNVGFFADAYFRRFPAVAEAGYQSGLVRAMAYVAERPEADFVVVTNWSNQPYIYALLLEPIAPKDLKRSPAVTCEGPRGFHQVLAVGRYLFVPSDPKHFPEAERRFRALLGGLPAESEGYLIETEQAAYFEDPRTVFRSRNADAVGSDRPCYVVRRWNPNAESPDE